MECCVIHKEEPNQVNVYERADRADPTRTKTLRDEFARQMTKRFRQLRGEIREAIVDKDVFGLKDEGITAQSVSVYVTPERGAFAFTQSERKVDSFMDWLEDRQRAGILETQRIPGVLEGEDRPWSDVYIKDSYKRGVQRSRYEMKKAGYDVPSIEAQGGIDAVMDMPFHADRVGTLYSRAYNELKGITSAMDSQIGRVLAEGIADGDHPSLLARKINSTISGKNLGELGITDTLGRFIPAERRARMMARTETIRAHHQATITEYESWKVEGVHVRAEWRTAGYNVCPECADYEMGGPYSLKEIRNMIPLHPDCRCIALPTEKNN